MRTYVKIRAVPGMLSRVAGALLIFCLAAAAPGQEPPAGPRGVEVVRVGAYPELHVDGRPFFVNSATFFYYRIPRDLWDASLERHRALGINTIDLPIPWNWHEPRDGVFDFEGKLNPRRDLRGLLQLLSEKGFKVIARPGPIIGADWLHGGYPAWLLAQPEFEADKETLRFGGPPPLAELAATDPDGAAHGWLNHPVHMERVRRWLAAVAAELAPYDARRSVTVRARNEQGIFESKEISGPLILVQVGDVASGSATGGNDRESYLRTLRETLAANGLGSSLFAYSGARGSLPGADWGAMGEWFPRWPSRPASDGMPYSLSARDAAEIESSVESLKAQASLPPMLIEFQAGWHAPVDDARPPESHPANTLLAWRLAMGHGARGVNYFPLQDSLTPAGYETLTANRYYRWDAALDLAGNERPRSRAVSRNAHVLEKWGEQLASSHKRADLAIVFSDSDADGRVGKQLSRVMHLAGLSFERLDPRTLSVEELLQHPVVVLLPRATPFSTEVQRKLVDYARRGGTLGVVPPRPAGEIMAALWPEEGSVSASDSGGRRFGEGRIVESEDFFSWVELEENFVQSRMRGEATSAEAALRQLLNVAGVRPIVRRGVDGPATGELAVTQLVRNAGTQESGSGFLVVTNLATEEAAEETIAVVSPGSNVHGGDEPLELPLQVPARESLLLPLHVPLCETAKPADRCRDEIVAAGAELLNFRRDGRTLELTFYAPGRATVLVRLDRQPSRVQMEEFRPEAEWVVEKHLLRLRVPRGAWPNFERVVRISLPYRPFLPEPPKNKFRGRTDYDYAVADGVRLPLGDDASLPMEPPLVVLDQDGNGQVLMQGTNFDELARTLDFKVEGAARGSDSIALAGLDTRQVVVNLKGARNGSNGGEEPAEGELSRGQVEAKSGRDRRQTLLYFISVPKEGNTAYRLDFDRDGAAEWALENTGLRLVVSPELGGRALALVDNVARSSLLSGIGGMIDAEAGAPVSRASYFASWLREETRTALRVADESGRVEKTFRLVDSQSVVVNYRLSLDPREIFAALNSVPGVPGERGTSFHWKAAEGDAPMESAAFTAGGATIELPEEVRAIEIRTPGKSTLVLEWDAGRMSVEMKNFSALLRLRFPAGRDTNQVRYKVRAEP